MNELLLWVFMLLGFLLLSYEPFDVDWPQLEEDEEDWDA